MKAQVPSAFGLGPSLATRASLKVGSADWSTFESPIFHVIETRGKVVVSTLLCPPLPCIAKALHAEIPIISCACQRLPMLIVCIDAAVSNCFRSCNCAHLLPCHHCKPLAGSLKQDCRWHPNECVCVIGHNTWQGFVMCKPHIAKHCMHGHIL